MPWCLFKTEPWWFWSLWILLEWHLWIIILWKKEVFHSPSLNHWILGFSLHIISSWEYLSSSCCYIFFSSSTSSFVLFAKMKCCCSYVILCSNSLFTEWIFPNSFLFQFLRWASMAFRGCWNLYITVPLIFSKSCHHCLILFIKFGCFSQTSSKTFQIERVYCWLGSRGLCWDLLANGPNWMLGWW